MKITTTLAVAVGLLGLAACKQSPTENKADQIEANAENTADNDRSHRRQYGRECRGQRR